jgi:uncharacterized repeat protein (TIGR02543 family)
VSSSFDLNDEPILTAPATLPSGYTRPVRANCLALNSGRQFGANRSGGRFHAAIDFVPSSNGDGTPVYAATAGRVMQNPYRFYACTDALEVRNDDGSIIRYSEISTHLRSGMRVEQGDLIGRIKKNCSKEASSMLHLEYYKGDGSGTLTDRSNSSNYTYVTPKLFYQRRSDLLDPTNFYTLSTFIAPPTKPTISWESTSKYAYVFGDGLTISWQPVSGASSYSIKIKQLAGEPNPSSDDEPGYSLKNEPNRYLILDYWTRNETSVTLTSGTYYELNQLTVGKYMKIYVEASLPNGTTTSDIAYFLIRPKEPTVHNSNIPTPGKYLNLAWEGTPDTVYNVYFKQLTEGLPDEGEDTSDEPGDWDDKSTYNNISSTSVSYPLPSSLLGGRYLKVWINAKAGYATSSWEARVPINIARVTTGKSTYVKGETITVSGTIAGIDHNHTNFFLKDTTAENTGYISSTTDLTSSYPQTTFSTSSLNPGTYYIYIVSYFDFNSGLIEVKDYTQITVAPGTYTVSFDSQGGSSVSSKSVTFGSTYGTLTTPTRTGYSFGGWYTGTNGTGSQITASTTVSLTSNQTLYAKWTVNAYTVSFDSQGGNSVSSKSVTYGSTYGTLTTPTRTGYSFGGWYTGTNGTGSQVTASTTVSLTSNQTLYAKWTVNTPTTNGWIQKNGKWYYVDANGTMVTNTWIQSDGKWYYFGTDGARVANAWAKSGTNWYYLGSDGGAMVSNTWIQSGTNRYYLGSNGARATNAWVKSGSNWYYLGADGGAMVTNTWVQSGTNWHYLGSDGAMVSDAWAKSGTNWHYLGSNGVMATNTWIQSDGKWYYLGSNGARVSNAWAKSGVNWHYLGSDGAMVSSTTIQSGGNWYYLGSNGARAANYWIQSGGKWYYFGADSGARVENDWVQSGGSWYYLKSGGVMAAGETIALGGQNYTFATNGVCTNK